MCGFCDLSKKYKEPVSCSDLAGTIVVVEPGSMPVTSQLMDSSVDGVNGALYKIYVSATVSILLPDLDCCELPLDIITDLLSSEPTMVQDKRCRGYNAET